MPPLRRSRARHERSFRGCQTCKARRVKCDEAFPECKRCTSTGRKCEGRESLKVSLFRGNRPDFPPGLQVSPLANHHLAFLPQRAQKRAFSYYLAKTAPYFASTLDNDFYSIVLPQAAQSSAVICNALLSISQFFELPLRHVTKHSLYFPLAGHHVQALEWYGEALSAEIEDRQPSESIGSMLSCMLFAVLELQQNNFAGGFALIRTGYSWLSILLTMTSKDLRGLGALHEALALAMGPVAIRTACLISTSRSLRAGDVSLNSSFGELQSAVFHLLSAVFGSLKDVWAANTEPKDLLFSTIQKAQQNLQRTLYALRETILAKMTGTNGLESQRISWLLSYLSVAEGWLEVSTVVATKPAELFDLTMLHVEKLLSEYRHEQELPHFFFYTAVLPASWFTALLGETVGQRYWGLRHVAQFTKARAEGQLVALVVIQEPGEKDIVETFLQIAHIMYENQGRTSRHASYFKIKL